MRSSNNGKSFIVYSYIALVDFNVYSANTEELKVLLNGCKKELNLISWNGKEAKYDIRDWDSEHKWMGKGVTLSVEELKKLRDILNGMEL